MSGDTDALGAARRAIDRRKRRERRRLRRSRRLRGRLVWAAAYVALLNLAAWFSLETPAELLTWEHLLQADKFEHLIVFLAATLVAIPLLGRWISAGILAVLLMNAGLVVEMVQAFDPGRTADYADFAYDQIGVAIGWLCAIPLRRWITRAGEADPAAPRRS